MDACTITANSANVGTGGVGIVGFNENQTLISNTWICRNSPSPNLDGEWSDEGGNSICDCFPDVSGDGQVNGVDLAIVLTTWGTDGGSTPQADINRDGVVDGSDLAILLSAWGPCNSDSVPAWALLLEGPPNPSVVTDANLRAAITATGLAWRVKDTATQIEMVLIPPGTFNMGCSASQSYACSSWGDENPVHQVTLTNAFYLGRYEVTQAQWQAEMGSNPSYFQSASTQVPQAQVPQRPVEQVSWNTIQGFLSQTGMRLPTEAEWEYAYRAGTTTAFHGYTGQLSGTNADNLLGNIAWFNQQGGYQTRVVGGKLGNGFGLHDMSGNVWEWVNDWWGSSYYSTSPSVNPQGPSSGTSRVLRGGGWFVNSYHCRASRRLSNVPDLSNIFFGFRVARNP